jgi:phosphatidylglycerophosphate synthase
MNWSTILRRTVKESNKKSLRIMIYRYISLPVVWAYVKLGISANAASLHSGILRLAAFYCFLTLRIIPAVILYQIGRLLDWVDGGIVRYTNTASSYGAMLDSLIDIFCDRLFFIVLPISLFLLHRDLSVLLLGFALFVLISIREMICLKAEQAEGKNYIRNRELSKQQSPILSSILSIAINTNILWMPFIILFPLPIVKLFYMFHGTVDLLRVIFYCKVALPSSKR